MASKWDICITTLKLRFRDRLGTDGRKIKVEAGSEILYSKPMGAGTSLTSPFKDGWGGSHDVPGLAVELPTVDGYWGGRASSLQGCSS